MHRIGIGRDFEKNEMDERKKDGVFLARRHSPA
jgi:hypothetical protein